MSIKAPLKADILSALNTAFDQTGNAGSARDAWADAVADAIATRVEAAINSTTVLFTLAAPNGPVTGSITLQSPPK